VSAPLGRGSAPTIPAAGPGRSICSAPISPSGVATPIASPGSSSRTGTAASSPSSACLSFPPPTCCSTARLGANPWIHSLSPSSFYYDLFLFLFFFFF
jgi:hypothetical protein